MNSKNKKKLYDINIYKQLQSVIYYILKTFTSNYKM
jgi:hypothetical protein